MIKILKKEDLDRQLIGLSAIAILILCFFYVYFVNQSIFNINQRRINENKIGDLQTKVASLESTYMSLTSEKVNLAFAHSLGFKDARDEYTFAVRNNKAVSLSYQANEI